MMYHKAMVFLDRETAKKIMEISDPRKIKQLGREVKNFHEDVWKYYRKNRHSVGFSVYVKLIKS